jgi:hypothetical protein
MGNSKSTINGKYGTIVMGTSSIGYVLGMFHLILWDATDSQTWAAGKSTN